jgi:hypothetical protein
MVDGTAQKAVEAAAPAPAPAAPAEGLTALERALGVPGTAAEGDAPAAPDTGQGIEIEGQRYTTAQLREAVLKAGDYTRKTQELAQQRQAVQAQQEAFATVLPFLQPELQRLAQVVGNAPPMPDPALARPTPPLRAGTAPIRAAMAGGSSWQHHRAPAAGAGGAMEQAVAAATRRWLRVPLEHPTEQLRRTGSNCYLRVER